MKSNYIFLVMLVGFGLYYGGRYLYFKPNYAKGENAPALTATLADGSPFKLEDLRGNYVLIDFWGSWCGPCRRENPALVELYKNHGGGTFDGGYGFEILSIALESSERRWRAAIESDGLYWKYHIGQFDQFSSPIAQEFGVRQIPTKFLLNPEGEIISINESVDSIAKMLDKQVVAQAR